MERIEFRTGPMKASEQRQIRVVSPSRTPRPAHTAPPSAGYTNTPKPLPPHVMAPAPAIEVSLAEACQQTIHAAVNGYRLRHFESKLTREQMAARLWDTDEGRLLRDLGRHRFARLPKTQALTKIQAASDAAQWMEHLRLLRAGITVG